MTSMHNPTVARFQRRAADASARLAKTKAGAIVVLQGTSVWLGCEPGVTTCRELSIACRDDTHLWALGRRGSQWVLMQTDLDLRR